MANQRAIVDDEWLSRGPEVMIRGEKLRALPVEELVWTKLYVLQKERCDWGDVFNLLNAESPSMDWDHLLNRMGDDQALLAGALAVFGWLAPDRADEIPPSVYSRLGIRGREGQKSTDSSGRVHLLDSRPWFTPHGG